MIPELAEMHGRQGEVAWTRKYRLKVGTRLRFPVSCDKPLAAKWTSFFLKRAVQTYVLFAARHHLVVHAFMLLGTIKSSLWEFTQYQRSAVPLQACSLLALLYITYVYECTYMYTHYLHWNSLNINDWLRTELEENHWQQVFFLVLAPPAEIWQAGSIWKWPRSYDDDNHTQMDNTLDADLQGKLISLNRKEGKIKNFW